MDFILDKIVSSFVKGVNLEFNDEDYVHYDKFIDMEIGTGGLIKHDEYKFTGEKLATKINTHSNCKIVALDPEDQIIDTKAKCQAVYFLVNNKIAVMTFSTNAITFFPTKHIT